VRKIYLHIGAHKCASTTLQINLGRNSETLREKYGLSYISPSNIALRPVGKHFMGIAAAHAGSHFDYDRSLNDARSDLLRMSSETAEGDLLLSWEGFCGHSSLDMYKGIYTHRDLICRSLTELLPDFDVRLLLIVRRQDEFVESCYLQQIKEQRALTFEDFTNPIDPNSISWLQLADVLSQAFGRERVTVIPFEMIRFSEGSSFFRTCLSSLTSRIYDDYEFDLIDQANPSISSVGVELALKMFPLMPESERRKNAAKYLFTEFSSSKYGRSILFHDFTRRVLLEHCKSENEQLFAKYMPAYSVCEAPCEASVFNYWFGADIEK
jgi:hypothetical protein